MPYLPGFIGGYNGVKTLTLTGLTDAGNDDIPAGAQDKDLAVLWQWIVGAGPPSVSHPTGWTAITGYQGTTATFAASYKLLGPSDPGTSISGLLSGVLAFRLIRIYRGDVPITTVTLGSNDSVVTNGNPAADTLLATGLDTPVILHGFYASNSSSVTGDTFSPSAETEVNHTAYIHEKYTIYDRGDTPLDVTLDLGDSGNDNTLASWALRVS